MGTIYPTVVVCFGDCESLVCGQASAAVGQENIVVGGDIYEALQAVQALENADLRRVNVYAVAKAGEDIAAESEALRRAFGGAFAVVTFVLILLHDGVVKISEKDMSNCYDTIFILSEKTENGARNAATKLETARLAAHLPLLQEKAAGFFEKLAAMSKGSGRILLATAGMWKHEPPAESEVNKDLQALARKLQDELAKGWEYSPQAHIDVETPHTAAIPTPDIRPWQLWGHTAREAEMLLYPHHPAAQVPPAPAPRGYVFPLATLEAGLSSLGAQLLASQTAAAEAETALKNAENTRILPRLVHNADHAVRRVCELRELRAKAHATAQNAACTRDELGAASRFHTALRQVIAQILELESARKSNGKKSLPFDLEIKLSAFLLRNDALLHEEFEMQDAAGNTVKMRLCGGFSVDDIG
jgi:hypothetical protein